MSHTPHTHTQLQGLSEKCGDAALNAVLLSNRAHVESLLGRGGRGAVRMLRVQRMQRVQRVQRVVQPALLLPCTGQRAP